MKKIYVIAGEASGDLHASNLIKHLHKLTNQNIALRGIGGDKLQEQGVVLFKHIKETNFMGFIEVLKNLPVIYKIFKQVQQDIQSFAPDLVLLVDYPGFNLRMAKFVKKLGIPIAYYISPQVWAWKKNRVHFIKKYVDKMLCILPFEKEFYQLEAGMEVEYVGHPLLDELEGYIGKPSSIKQDLHLNDEPIIALLPGSREQEVKNMLSEMLKVSLTFPKYQFVVAAAPTLPIEFYMKQIGNKYPIKIVRNRTYDLLNVANAAIVTSGTATLETGLFGVPMVVCYKGNALSYIIAKRLIHVQYISLVNLILNKPAVKELIQYDCNASEMLTELNRILHDKYYREKIQQDLSLLRKALGNSGASERAAKSIYEYFLK